MSHQISHQKIQTGVKEFNCDQCKKVFKQGYHFIRHKKKKKICTGKREFECDQCKKYLYQRIRTGVKEFKYDQC